MNDFKKVWDLSNRASVIDLTYDIPDDQKDIMDVESLFESFISDDRNDIKRQKIMKMEHCFQTVLNTPCYENNKINIISNKFSKCNGFYTLSDCYGFVRCNQCDGKDVNGTLNFAIYI